MGFPLLTKFSTMSKLTQNITNSSRSIKGLKPKAYWAFRSDVQLTLVDNKVTAVTAAILGTIDGCNFFINAGGEQVLSDFAPVGFKQKFTAIINDGGEFLDGMDDIVLFVESYDGTKYALGARYGLWKTSQAAMSNDNLSTTAVEFTSREGMEELCSEYLLDCSISSIPTTTDYEAIEELTIGNGEYIALSVDSNKKCYVIKPDGVVIESASGVIDTPWYGSAGYVKLIIPKDSYLFDISSLNTMRISGSLNTTHAGLLKATNCININNITAINCSSVEAVGATSLTNFKTPVAVNVNFANCTLTSKAIGDFLLDAFENNPTANGGANFSGGNNAFDVDINSYLVTKGTTLLAVKAQLGTWTITLNEAP